MKILIVNILFLIIVISSTYSQKLQSTNTHVLFNVKVMDFSDEARTNERILIEGKTNKKRFSGLSNSKGIYSVLVPKNETYKIKYMELNEYIDYSNLYVPPDSGYFTYEVNVRFESKEIYVLENLNFESNKSEILKDSYTSLNQLYDLLYRKPRIKIEIAGHTDNTGNADLNMTLSQARATSVMNYLTSKGIAKDRIVAIGYGDTMPIAENDTEEGKLKNRRTEVKILTE